MNNPKAPTLKVRAWFPFYGADFYGDEKVQLMSCGAQGLFLKALWNCWVNGTIPADEMLLSRLFGLPLAEFQGLWSEVRPCFVPEGSDRLKNPRLEQERHHAIHQSSIAHEKAVRRWGKAMPQDMPLDMQQHPSSSASTEQYSTELNKSIREVFDYFNAKTKRHLKMNDIRKDIIKKAIERHGGSDCLRAIDNFSQSQYHFENGYVDVVYALGIRSKIDNCEKWRDMKPQKTGAQKAGVPEPGKSFDKTGRIEL